MNEMSEILVAAGGTVTITTEEYRSLVARSTCLDLLLHFAKSKSYVTDDIALAITDLLKPSEPAAEGETPAAEETDNAE